MVAKSRQHPVYESHLLQLMSYFFPDQLVREGIRLGIRYTSYCNIEINLLLIYKRGFWEYGDVIHDNITFDVKKAM